MGFQMAFLVAVGVVLIAVIAAASIETQHVGRGQQPQHSPCRHRPPITRPVAPAGSSSRSAPTPACSLIGGKHRPGRSAHPGCHSIRG